MILLVEDDPVQRQATAVLLAARGYTVRACATAADALPMLADHLPRVLVLDLVMPGLDGIGLLRLLDEQPRTAGLAVIVTTGEPDPLPPFPRQVTVLRKPFTIETLADTIARLAPLESHDAS